MPLGGRGFQPVPWIPHLAGWVLCGARSGSFLIATPLPHPARRLQLPTGEQPVPAPQEISAHDTLGRQAGGRVIGLLGRPTQTK